MGGRTFLRVLCLICAVSTVIAGWTLLPNRREPVSQAEREFEKQAEAFRGIITVWHINGWRTGGTSASTLLSQILADLERQNSGVYFTMETLPVQQAQERMVKGEMPDILSFPGGMTLPTNIAWQDLSCPSILPCYAGALERESSFLPWIASDALIMIRNTSLSACGAAAPEDDWTLKQLCDLAEELTYQTKGRNAQRVYGIASGNGRWPQLSAWGVPEMAILPGDFTEREAWNQLVEGDVSMLVAGPWEQMTLQWRMQEDRGPDLTIVPWPTDVPVLRSVQWVGCRLSGDEKKDALCQKTVEKLLSENVQKKVKEQACCLPVIALEEEDYPRREQFPVLFALPGREVVIREKWEENYQWTADLGIYLCNPKP